MIIAWTRVIVLELMELMETMDSGETYDEI